MRVPGAGVGARGDAIPRGGAIAVPLRLRHEDGELSFISTITTFGTAIDITAAELSIETFFPADAATAAVMRGRTPGVTGPPAARQD